MRVVVASALLGLAACSAPPDPAQQAENEFNMAADNRDAGDACEAAKKAKAAYLQKGDKMHYQQWSWRVFNICNGYDDLENKS